jgi:hypothetical protein
MSALEKKLAAAQISVVPSVGKRYTQAVDRGLRYCIADLETVIAETDGELKLHRDEMPKEEVQRDVRFMEDCREAIEWIRVQRAKHGGAS